jgi:hypothetical protein
MTNAPAALRPAIYSGGRSSSLVLILPLGPAWEFEYEQ